MVTYEGYGEFNKDVWVGYYHFHVHFTKIQVSFTKYPQIMVIM